MSAVIQNEYTGNNSTTTYSFTFPYLKTSDIKASLDGVATTAFTLPNATTLQFNTAPGSGVSIKIFRETSVDDLTATFYAGSAIKSEDLNDNFTQNLYKTQEVGTRSLNTLGGTMTGDLTLGTQADIVFEGATADAHETTIKVVDPTADRTITFPNVTGTVVTTGDTGTVATGMIAADAVTGAKIADDQINSEHYVDGSIDTQHIADAQVTTAKIADSNVTTGKLAADAVTAAKLADNAVVTANITNNAITNAKILDLDITGSKIASTQIDSRHYISGSIDNAHLADNAVTQAKMADDSVGTAELVDGSVDTARLADNSVTLAKMTDNSVGTSEIVDDAVTNGKLATNSVSVTKLADNAVNTGKIQDGVVTGVKIANNTISAAKIIDGNISTAKIADSGVTTAKIASDAVTTVKIVNDAITSTKIADDAVGSSEIGDGVIDTVHVGAAQITTAKIADSNITTAKITDANVTTAKIANDAITIGKIGCEQTTISDSDSHIPTSGAVVDYVAAQIAPIGGLEVIATEVAFPNTQPASGVVISISDAGGVVVDGSGVSTTGRTVGGSTVTINGFPASLQSKTMAADIGLMVSSTGSSQTYTYHKILAKEADVEQLSNDINDFASRYRVGSSNPTSSLDNGDLFFNTGTGKMLVYNGTNTAWEEVQSIGNFFISTFSEAFDGSRTQFTLSNAPTNVQQVILSLNGVIQKPGTAFTLSGSTVTLASAPASGTDYFAVVMGSTVNIGTPSNDTVSTAVLQDDSVTAAKIAAGAVGSTELAANAVITSKIADESITLAKLAHGTSSNNGKFLRANNGADPTFESVITDLVNDTSPQLGGDLDTNSHEILLDDDHKIKFGASEDLKVYHSAGSHSFVEATGQLRLCGTTNVLFRASPFGDVMINAIADGAVELMHDGTKKFETTSTGTKVTGINYVTGNLGIGKQTPAQLGGDGGKLLHIAGADNPEIVLERTTSGTEAKASLRITDAEDLSFRVQDGSGTQYDAMHLRSDIGSVELNYQGSTKLQTTAGGVIVTGDFQTSGSGGTITANEHLKIPNDTGKLQIGASNDLQIYHDGSESFVKNNTGNLEILTNEFRLRNNSGGETFMMASVNGDVQLWYDNSKKFETTSYGVLVSGNIQSNTIYPSANNSYDLGTSSTRWANIYTNDLNLSNEGSSNDVDGSWGDWTIQEGESDLFLKNNRSGKKYKFNLTEVS